MSSGGVRICSECLVLCGEIRAGRGLRPGGRAPRLGELRAAGFGDQFADDFDQERRTLGHARRDGFDESFLRLRVLAGFALSQLRRCGVRTVTRAHALG